MPDVPDEPEELPEDVPPEVLPDEPEFVVLLVDDGLEVDFEELSEVSSSSSSSSESSSLFISLFTVTPECLPVQYLGILSEAP